MGLSATVGEGVELAASAAVLALLGHIAATRETCGLGIKLGVGE
jgi:hypothetical protein